MIDLCLAFEVHQPYRLKNNFFWDRQELKSVPKGGLFDHYFDSKIDREVFQRAAKKCYLPANQILLEKMDKKDYRVAFSLSGIFLEQCEKWNRDLLSSFRQLAETGCVEFLEQTYYHSLSGLWTDRSEWIDQIKLHREVIKSFLGYEPTFLENTELMYNDEIARLAEELGYKGIMTEGAEKILGSRSPNYVYRPKGCKIGLLLRNYRLSDDIAFRFSSRSWDQWPLFADKYADWLANTPGDCIVIFMDYETFGEHHWPETGIHEFFRSLPAEISKRDLNTRTPSEIVQRHEPVDEIHVDPLDTVSWADRRDTEAWLGNTLQWACYRNLNELQPYVRESGDEEFLKVWRYLQISDHLYYAYTGGGSSGEVHSYFSHFRTPHDAAVTFLSVLGDFKARVMEEIIPASSPFVIQTPSGPMTAHSLKGLREALPQIDPEILSPYLRRNDLVKWSLESLVDPDLAEAMSDLKVERYSPERVRKRLMEIVDERWKTLSAKREMLRRESVRIRSAQMPERKKLPTQRTFWFHKAEGVYTGEFASSLEEFAEKVRKVSDVSIQFHSKRGDFEAWIRDAARDAELAEKVRIACSVSRPLEELRKEIYELVRERIREKT